MAEEHNGHIVDYKFNILVWIDLLIFTLITIEIAAFDFRALTVVVALVVATIKTYLVVTYFMHLRFENLFLRSIVIGVTVLFIALMVFLFSDYLYF
ncbi:MAG: cytochrome C oxidase subunit IV family protein [Bacteroidales bacterium]